MSSAELYDPATGSWSSPTAGSLAPHANVHTATLLPDGEVLVAGGIGTNYSLSSAELYQPKLYTTAETGAPPVASAPHALTHGDAVALRPGVDRGRILWRLFEQRGTLRAGDRERLEQHQPPLLRGRAFHTATLLLSGKVLAAGGRYFNSYLRNAELYDTGLGFDPELATFTK